MRNGDTLPTTIPSEIWQKRNVKEFSGQIAAVDASCWLHKGLSASLARSGRRDR